MIQLCYFIFQIESYSFILIFTIRYLEIPKAVIHYFKTEFNVYSWHTYIITCHLSVGNLDNETPQHTDSLELENI